MKTRLHCLLAVALGLAWCLVAASVHAGVPPYDVAQVQEEPVVLSPYLEVLEDASRTLQVHDVVAPGRQGQFAPPQSKGTAVGFGFQSSAIWLKLELANSGTVSAERIFEIAYASLVKVDIYQVVDGTVVSGDFMGTARPMQHRLLPNRHFTSPIQIAPGGTTTVYVRAESHHPLIIPAKLWTPSAFIDYERSDYAVQAGYFGIAFGMFTFNFLLLLALRDRIYLLYLVWMGCLLMTIAVGTGLAKQYLWPDSVVWASYSNAFADNWTVAALIVFVRQMLDTSRFLPWPDRTLKLLAWFYLLVPFGFYLNFHAFAPPILVLTTCCALLVLGISVRIAVQGERAAIIFLLAFSTLIVSSIVGALWGLDLLPTNFLTVYGFQIGSAIEMILLALALADRFNESRRAVVRAQSLALEAEKGRVEAFRQSERVLEVRVQERTAALSESLEKLTLMQRELVQSEKMASLGSLVAGVAHELNTPIGNALTVASSLRDSAQALAGELNNPAIRKSTLLQFTQNVIPMSELIESACNQAATLVNSFKRVAVDQTSEQRRKFDLADLVQDICASLAPSFRRSAFDLRVELTSGMTCDGYPGPLGQVIANLVQNAAIHAFDPGQVGSIVVRGTESGNEVQVSVEDDGKGIAPEVLVKIFDPFFTTRLGEGGSGLGLAIAMNIVKGVLGGTLSVQSVLGNGTTFTMRFPKVTPMVHQAGQSAADLNDFHRVTGPADLSRAG